MLKETLEMVKAERRQDTEIIELRLSKPAGETIYRTSTDLNLDYDLTAELLIEIGCNAIYKLLKTDNFAK